MTRGRKRKFEAAGEDTNARVKMRPRREGPKCSLNCVFTVRNRTLAKGAALLRNCTVSDYLQDLVERDTKGMHLSAPDRAEDAA
jgi:hypothetical protein